MLIMTGKTFLYLKIKVTREYNVESEKLWCGTTENMKITWGGPAVVFRWDGLTEVDIKYCSVREIILSDPPPLLHPEHDLLSFR